jgi:Ca2+-binding EF-hand superfamily protein
VARDAGLISNFNKLDKKGDGKLTPDEWSLPAMFKVADTNGDGVVTKEEYISFQHKLRNPVFFAELQFREHDTRGDGKLTPDEWKKPVRFKLADTKGSGVVTKEEFIAFQKKMRSQDFSLDVEFKELDKKGDGKLTPDELRNPALFAKIDAEKVGFITFDKFKAYLKSPH